MLDLIGDDDNESELLMIPSSPYCDDQSFCDKIKQNKNKIIILNTNIESLDAKLESLSTYINLLRTHNCFIDIICLQETGHDDSTAIELQHIEGYDLIFFKNVCQF